MSKLEVAKLRHGHAMDMNERVLAVLEDTSDQEFKGDPIVLLTVNGGGEGEPDLGVLFHQEGQTYKTKDCVSLEASQVEQLIPVLQKWLDEGRKP
jgi:hypothetical protein